MRWTAALVLVLCASCRHAPPPAPAAAPTAVAPSPVAADDVEGAKQAYKDGHAAYEKGQYREALALFQRADQMHHDALLLFNIGQSHRLLNENQPALDFYRKYLEEKPDAPNRKMVEQKIEELQQIVGAPPKRPKL